MNSGPRTASVDVVVERWSSDEEGDALLSILAEEGILTGKREASPSAPEDADGGVPRAPQTLAWDLRYAHQSALDEGGRRIVVGTDWPIGFREARNQSRTMDYPFTSGEFRLHEDGRPRPRKNLASSPLLIDRKKHPVLENYGSAAR
ncbi:MAG TPA: hypothetical protein VFO36_09980 [Nitrospiraceae bacterium]|nr:hypothetical protein [Nitrospiraceae bacterium]